MCELAVLTGVCELLAGSPKLECSKGRDLTNLDNLPLHGKRANDTYS